MRNLSWLKSGIVLGLVFFLAVLLVKPVGVSTQFSVLGGMLQNAISPTVTVEQSGGKTVYKSDNPYYNKSDGAIAKGIAEPINYESVFVFSIPIGAGIGYLLMRDSRRTDYEHSEKRNYYLRGFIGGFLTLFGARLADGCTSGHMMSGMMQSSVSGYLFAVSVFVVAIPTAIYFAKEG